MSFVSKSWTDLIAQYPNRYRLVHTDLSEEQVTMINDFGTTNNPDVFDADHMDNLEGRIAAAFGDVCEILTGSSAPTSTAGKNGDLYVQTETTGNVTEVVGLFVKLAGAWLEISTGASLPQAEGGAF